MTTLIIDNSSKEAKKLIEFLKVLPYVKVIDNKPNKTTQKAIEDIQMGKVTRTNDITDLMQKLNQ
jgi:hypothetical protein